MSWKCRYCPKTWHDLETRAYMVHVFRFHWESIKPVPAKTRNPRPYTRATAWTRAREGHATYAAITGYTVTEGIPNGKV